MGEPHPININHTIIVIPDLLLFEKAKLTELTHATSIGQCIILDYFVYAPLHPWDDPIWQHSELQKIVGWRKGRRPKFPEVWSQYLSEQ